MMALCLTGIKIRQFVFTVSKFLRRIGTDIAFGSLRHWDASHGPPCVTTTRGGLGNQAALHFLELPLIDTMDSELAAVSILQACTTPQQLCLSTLSEDNS